MCCRDHPPVSMARETRGSKLCSIGYGEMGSIFKSASLSLSVVEFEFEFHVEFEGGATHVAYLITDAVVSNAPAQNCPVLVSVYFARLVV